MDEGALQWFRVNSTYLQTRPGLTGPTYAIHSQSCSRCWSDEYMIFIFVFSLQLMKGRLLLHYCTCLILINYTLKVRQVGPNCVNIFAYSLLLKDSYQLILKQTDSTMKLWLVSPTYKPWIGNCLLKLYRVTREMQDYLRDTISWLLWSMTIQPVVGVYELYSVNDYIKLSSQWFDYTNYIYGFCLVMFILLTPLACVRLSKHYTLKTTTMYRSLGIEGNGI